jgi:hypothetical protein
MSELNSIQSAWIIYFAGSIGCTIAAWWMFLWAWRFVRYAAVVTVMTLLFTPYAIDSQTMVMAPAIYTLVFEGISQGLTAILPLIKVMLGIWLIGLILAAILVFLTRNMGAEKSARSSSSSREQQGSRRTEYEDSMRQDDTRRQDDTPRISTRSLNRGERQARDELLKGDVLKGEVPIRAIRD